MCDRINENEIYSVMDNKSMSASDEITFCQRYERRMTLYMLSVPHIPPTTFELKVRHNEIKADVVKQYKNVIHNKNNGKECVHKLETLIEKVYINLVKKNAKEYKTCQAAFVIGWKCNINKPHTDSKSIIDDRF